MLFFNKRKVSGSGLLTGFTDWHSHILPGVDDGVKHIESSLKILDRLEQEGVQRVVFTPHIMEDVPNATADLRQRFDTFLTQYKGGIQLSLAAENMMDHLFEQRLEADDLLPLHDRFILVETSYFNPPYQMEQLLERIRERGYTPVLAHPERYPYLGIHSQEVAKMKEMGIFFQVNVLSLNGFYGEAAKQKGFDYIKAGMVEYLGTDTHNMRYANALIETVENKEVQKMIATHTFLNSEL